MPKGVYKREVGHIRSLKKGWVKRKSDPSYIVGMQNAVKKRNTLEWQANVSAANKKRIYIISNKDNSLSIDENYQGA